MSFTTRKFLFSAVALMAMGAVSANAQDPSYRDVDHLTTTQPGLIGPKGVNRYMQMITVQNNSIIPIWGTFWLVFQALPANVTIENRTGLTQCGENNPNPKPFIQFSPGRDGTLQPGESAQVYVEFYAPAANKIEYKAIVFAGQNLKGLSVTGDYDGDRRTDLALFRYPSRQFIVFRSTDKQTDLIQAPPDAQHAIVGDFDGDGKADAAAMLMPSRSFWIRMSSNNVDETVPALTQNKLHLTPADYDGDGRTDIAVYDRDSQKFRYHSAKFNMPISLDFPMSANAVPAVADYDGDGKADMGSYDYMTGEYKYMSTIQLKFVTTNVSNPMKYWMVPMPGNFNGDAWGDPAVYAMQKGFWFMQLSGGISVSYAGPDGFPMPFDFDGDGKTDRGIYQTSSHMLKVQLASGAPYADVQFGQQGDGPWMPSYVLIP
jgi:hypothetical protein